jgi:hypothetical protein
MAQRKKAHRGCRFCPAVCGREASVNDLALSIHILAKTAAVFKADISLSMQTAINAIGYI